MQGGSPNNVLALLKAEEKVINDKMFPFLVHQRMPNTKEILKAANLGPGLYNVQSENTEFKQSNRNLFPYNGQSTERFNDFSLSRNPGPGHYNTQDHKLLDESVNTFSQRYDKNTKNIYL